MKNRVRARRRAVVGYALLEALVAVVVAAVGFIGAARMQTFGLTLNNSALSRQKATLLGYQMTDRVRGNAAAGVAAYNNSAPGATTCLNSACTPGQLAGADLTQWQADVAAQLPGGQGVVCIDSTPSDGDAAPGDPMCDGVGQVLAVKVWWTDNISTTRFVTVIRP
jgi:type IV pilus assembly protein PilV